MSSAVPIGVSTCFSELCTQALPIHFVVVPLCLLPLEAWYAGLLSKCELFFLESTVESPVSFKVKMF